MRFRLLPGHSTSSNHHIITLSHHVRLENRRIKDEPSFEKVPRPLCPTSAHSLQTHSSWPKSVMCRISRLGACPKECRSSLLAQYESVPCHPLLLARLEAAAMQGPQPSTMHNSESLQQEAITCVLKYHPVLQRAVRDALRITPIPRSLNFKIRLAWQNALPCLDTWLVRHNDHIHKHRDGSSAEGCVFSNSRTMYMSLTSILMDPLAPV